MAWNRLCAIGIVGLAVVACGRNRGAKDPAAGIQASPSATAKGAPGSDAAASPQDKSNSGGTPQVTPSPGASTTGSRRLTVNSLGLSKDPIKAGESVDLIFEFSNTGAPIEGGIDIFITVSYFVLSREFNERYSGAIPSGTTEGRKTFAVPSELGAINGTLKVCLTADPKGTVTGTAGSPVCRDVTVRN